MEVYKDNAYIGGEKRQISGKSPRYTYRTEGNNKDERRNKFRLENNRKDQYN